MKTPGFACLALLAVLVVSGCAPQTASTAQPPAATAQQQQQQQSGANNQQLWEKPGGSGY
jgi:hypothetical protein